MVSGKIHEIALGGEKFFGPARHLGPDLGEHHFACAPLYKLRLELLLQLADLHRQRRLRHRAGIRCTAKMAVLGERPEITKLTQCEHRR